MTLRRLFPLRLLGLSNVQVEHIVTGVVIGMVEVDVAMTSDPSARLDSPSSAAFQMSPPVTARQRRPFAQATEVHADVMKVNLPEGRAQPPHARGRLFLRASLLVVIVPALIVVSYGAFSLQGHREDFPSKPMQTWPIGVASLALAAALSWSAARPSRGLQPVVVAIALLFFLAAWAAYLP